jgi:ankyrin repeat protein
VKSALTRVGADVNTAKDDGVTPLFLVATKSHETVVRVHFEAGADIDEAKDDAATPLSASMRRDDDEKRSVA